MDLNQAFSLLRKEKELLAQALDLAECQLELLESGRIEDFDVLLSLRATPMTQLAGIETNFGEEMPEIGNTLSANEASEFQELNTQIITMANRIIEIDQKSEQLAEQHHLCISWPF